MYPKELFYATHKISQSDFLDKLRSAKSKKEVKSLIDGLFDDESVSGRRGVMQLKDGVALVRKKIQLKEKHRKFAQKVSGNNEGMPFSQLRQSGILRSDQLF